MTENPLEPARLLVVSRDFAVLRLVWSIGRSNSWQLANTANPSEAMDRVRSGETPDLLLLDLPQGNTDGLRVLRSLRQLRPTLPIIVIGQFDDDGGKQEALWIGARDYLVRPLDERQLEMTIRRNLSTGREAIRMDTASHVVELISDEIYFIGISPIMQRLRGQAALLAESNVPVLILGEGGTGKETIARLIHKLSARCRFEFAKVNCAALPSELLERELFGCGRNGAIALAPGKLELCARGTILLDEITEMPMAMQAKLLQVMQNSSFVRPGTSTDVDVDIRILATSTTNLEHAISENRIREDLYYRLRAYTIHVPPLRERKEEIHVLSLHFMRQLAKHYGLPPREFSPAILEAGQDYSWPGNLRELQNFVRYYLVGNKKSVFEKSRSYEMEIAHDPASASPGRTSPPGPSLIKPRVTSSRSGSLRSLVQNVKAEAETNAIADALEKTGWNRKAAARLLNISYRTLLYKIERYQMRSPNSSLLPENGGFRNKGTGLGGNGPTD